ncbi:hypothetical protein BDV25DRAFT_169609 [Aspergillus avenaceus]|uniref:Uncharacterized protein n=1 Tax=Aspergillus avenaceus TaxID=36643 RepID=A0A5N6TKA7_ASPAV|nr:hypothetical protein BDV25DRAFT_169609 [Aspergillus avenaceus]
METSSNSTDSNPQSCQPCPVRILVQTLTHLVPSDIPNTDRDPYNIKFFSMLDRICRYHWNCDFAPEIHRCASYGDDFAYNNRFCFFLIDYGTTSNDDDVPILCYEWTGQDLQDKPFPELLQSKDVQDELKDMPFTPRRREPRERPPVRDIVRGRLRRTQHIRDRDIEHLKQHPEDMEWLQRKLKPRLWAKLLDQIESQPRRKEEEQKMGIIYEPYRPSQHES